MESRLARRGVLWVVVALVLGAQAPLAFGQTGTGVLIGTVLESGNRKPLEGALVTVSSPSLQGEQVAVSDSSGFYRAPNLPPGIYSVRVDRDAYLTNLRDGIQVRADSTLRLNVEMAPEATKAEAVAIVQQAPTVDVGSSSTGTNLSAEFTQRVPLSTPEAKGSANRSFESVASVAPGAQQSDYGVSLSGASSNENQYLIDGLSVSNPGFGTLGTPLSSEFVEEVNVITGGYMPEYGRATGGILNVVTKTGSNDFHGSVFGFFTPGGLEGHRTPVVIEGQTIGGSQGLSYIGDIGFDLGGPIIKDRLWFYTGFDIARTRYNLHRNINAIVLDAMGNPVENDLGYTQTEPVPGTNKKYLAESQNIQWMGKLTYALNGSNRLTLSSSITPTSTGGNGQYAIDPLSESPESVTAGSYGAMAHRQKANAYDTALRWSTESPGKSWLVDTTFGWHHEFDATMAADGSRAGSGQGLANEWQIEWRQNQPGPHSITEFEPFGMDVKAICDPTGAPTRCPLNDYFSGGAGLLNEQTFDRFQVGSVATHLFQALGHHVAKVGASMEYTTYEHLKSLSGGVALAESEDGTEFEDIGRYGVLIAPDVAKLTDPKLFKTTSIVAGGFLQDSWSVLDVATINVGLRYDTQYMNGADGRLGLALPNQWSPRAGVIYDFTKSGRSKVFANYARFYESPPLDLADVPLVGDSSVQAIHDRKLCDPRDVQMQKPGGACLSDANYTNAQDQPNPNKKFQNYALGPTPVDPDLKAQSSDELVGGVEYEIMPFSRLGVTYTKRWINIGIDDLSRDNAQTFFLGNPGYGVSTDFEKVVRDYDAGTIYFVKSFQKLWLGQISYTVSSLRGNTPGLIGVEGTIEINHSSNYDTKTIMINRRGPLPGDHRHDFKAFLAKDWMVAAQQRLSTGLALSARSGAPTSYLGAYPDYGVGETYVLPAGTGPRLPWVFRADVQLGYRFNLSPDRAVTFTIDVFNLLNFQTETERDQVYTTSDVYGVKKLSDLKRVEDGMPLMDSEKNPNFGNPVAYQAPRVFRFGLRSSF